MKVIIEWGLGRWRKQEKCCTRKCHAKESQLYLADSSQPAKACAEQLDYTWVLGKITGDHVRNGVGGGGIIGYSASIYCKNVCVGRGGE